MAIAGKTVPHLAGGCPSVVQCMMQPTPLPAMDGLHVFLSNSWY